MSHSAGLEVCEKKTTAPKKKNWTSLRAVYRVLSMSFAESADAFLDYLDAALACESPIVAGAIEADHETAIEYDVARARVSASFRANMRSILTTEGIASAIPNSSSTFYHPTL